ncbi:Ribokinase-like protein [Russula earlei]|uniref:Ribokinase-like protein n=1 Tax=Russula earlei TaxID=71964 RepID=A0ACC0UFZ1_9AGAM|nr:Ribokinase-like protein [Russula earlei]
MPRLPFPLSSFLLNLNLLSRLPPCEVGMIVDKGVDFPQEIDAALKTYGESMWFFREQAGVTTTRALNTYSGDHRDFQYLTPRRRITPCDLTGTPLFRPTTLHFICSPARAAVIMSQVSQVEGWSPVSIYEPIPYRCVPEELPALRNLLPLISVLSPNAEEALSLLSVPLPPTKSSIERACHSFLDFGLGPGGTGWVIIRSGSLGAYVACRSQPGAWIDAYWRTDERVVDVTGAGNSFLGGLAAGLVLTNGDVFEGMCCPNGMHLDMCKPINRSNNQPCFTRQYRHPTPSNSTVCLSSLDHRAMFRGRSGMAIHHGEDCKS